MQILLLLKIVSFCCGLARFLHMWPPLSKTIMILASHLQWYSPPCPLQNNGSIPSCIITSCNMCAFQMKLVLFSGDANISHIFVSWVAIWGCTRDWRVSVMSLTKSMIRYSQILSISILCYLIECYDCQGIYYWRLWCSVIYPWVWSVINQEGAKIAGPYLTNGYC